MCSYGPEASTRLLRLRFQGLIAFSNPIIANQRDAELLPSCVFVSTAGGRQMDDGYTRTCMYIIEAIVLANMRCLLKKKIFRRFDKSVDKSLIKMCSLVFVG